MRSHIVKPTGYTDILRDRALNLFSSMYFFSFSYDTSKNTILPCKAILAFTVNYLQSVIYKSVIIIAYLINIKRKVVQVLHFTNRNV